MFTSWAKSRVELSSVSVPRRTAQHVSSTASNAPNPTPHSSARDRNSSMKVSQSTEAVVPFAQTQVPTDVGLTVEHRTLEPPEKVVSDEIAKWVEEHYTFYPGDDNFLAPPTERTEKLNAQVQALLKEELAKGILDVDASTPSGITAFAPGYIDRELEVIVGLQTDAPLKRSIKPFGGYRLVERALESYGYKPDPKLREVFEKFRKTHNDGVFDAYTKEMRAARKSHILTGLPDGYGRGRIIGDYRRVALYGVDRLIQAKAEDRDGLDGSEMDEERIQLREEVSEQIKALHALKKMALSYGFDISQPAQNAQEAVQWLYFAYLAAIKEQDGAAMSFGRIDAFLDIRTDRPVSVETEIGQASETA